jgi:general stress protein 26
VQKPTLEEALGCFGSRTVISLATCLGNRPAVRPMTVLRLEGGFYTLTFCDSRKVAQIRANPRCQMFLGLADGEDSGFVRADCTAVEIVDEGMKEKLYRAADYAHQFWSGASDPNFCLLRLDIDVIELMRPGDMYAASIEMDGRSTT